MASSWKFAVYTDNAGAWRWRLRGRNGEDVAMSSEAYASKQSAKASVKLVQNNAVKAEVLVEG
jgi:uncharacterized protein YegP (UPF0339 family)